MGRTLTYEVFYDRPLSREMRREILLAQTMLNHHFTWTCEELTLELFEPIAPGKRAEFVYFSDSKDPRPRIGSGFTKVAGDEWNACLVTTFMRWVSTRLSEATISLYDEGDYIRVPLQFSNGQAELNDKRIQHIWEFLAQNGLSEELKQFNEKVKQAREGDFFNAFTAGDYADRPEIREVGFTKASLAKVTLAEVAEILMPWDTKWLKAARTK